MNDRILQLALKAGMSDDKYGMFFANDKHNEDGVDLQTFAELIIQDCIDCVDGYTKPRTFDTHYDAVEQIKHLFGIK